MLDSINHPRRYVQGDHFISTANPHLEIHLDPKFQYIGHIEFDLSNIAHVDRHIFVEAIATHIRRMFILQFEGFLDNNAKTYHFAMDNPIDLGSIPFTHHNYFFSNAADIAANPAAEIAHTNRYLNAKGFQIEDEQMTSRFARIVGTAKRHELILFYHENLRDTGYNMDQISRDDEILEPYTHIAQELTQRSLTSFRVLEYDD